MIDDETADRLSDIRARDARVLKPMQWVDEAISDRRFLVEYTAALEKQLETLRNHLGTLTPGGSHTCITCAAHCIVIGDLEAKIAQLEASQSDAKV